jgi:hypothetical protein
MHAIGGKREQPPFIMPKSDRNRNSPAPAAGFRLETARDQIEGYRQGPLKQAQKRGKVHRL